MESRSIWWPARRTGEQVLLLLILLREHLNLSTVVGLGICNNCSNNFPISPVGGLFLHDKLFWVELMIMMLRPRSEGNGYVAGLPLARLALFLPNLNLNSKKVDEF